MSRKAKFVYWFISPFSDIPTEPMFKVISSDIEFPKGSTVGGGTLLTLGVNIPRFPDFEKWKRETSSKRKCVTCYRSTPRIADWFHHREIAHGVRQFNSHQNHNLGAIMKILSIVVMLLIASNRAFAWEYPRNPDRFPSIGFNASSMDLSGHRDEVSMPSIDLTNALGGSQKFASNSIGADLRLPVNDGLTLTLAADSFDTRSDFMRNGNVYKESQSLTGFRYSLGLRLYFNK